jgi:hypothetical protein
VGPRAGLTVLPKTAFLAAVGVGIPAVEELSDKNEDSSLLGCESVVGRVVTNVSKDYMRALGSVETSGSTPCHITEDLSPQQRL